MFFKNIFLRKSRSTQPLSSKPIVLFLLFAVQQWRRQQNVINFINARFVFVKLIMSFHKFN